MEQILSSVVSMIESLSQQIASSPTAALHITRSENYAILGEDQLALNDGEIALKIDPKSAKAHNHMAALLIHKGDYIGAEEAAKNANTLDSEIEDIHWMIAAEGRRLTEKINNQPTAVLYCKRGVLSFSQGALLPAKEDLEKAISLDHNLNIAYTYLIETCMKLGLPEEAEMAHDDIADRDMGFSSDKMLMLKKLVHLERKINHSPALGNYFELSKITSDIQTIQTYKKSITYNKMAEAYRMKG